MFVLAYVVAQCSETLKAAQKYSTCSVILFVFYFLSPELKEKKLTNCTSALVEQNMVMLTSAPCQSSLRNCNIQPLQLWLFSVLAGVQCMPELALSALSVSYTIAFRLEDFGIGSLFPYLMKKNGVKSSKCCKAFLAYMVR